MNARFNVSVNAEAVVNSVMKKKIDFKRFYWTNEDLLRKLVCKDFYKNGAKQSF